jgi:polyisoprenoid-binding protein YceI
MRKLFLMSALVFSSAPILAKTEVTKALNWAMIPAQSSIAFSGTHAGRTFNGTFKKWTATIRFDPQKLDEANATVRIELASAFTGDKTYDKTLPEADWFNVKSTPIATFQSQKFRSTTAPGKYIADGVLTLRNLKVPVSVPFTLAIVGDTATMSGEVSLKRMAFNLGSESDATGAWVSLDIPVKLKVVARMIK